MCLTAAPCSNMWVHHALSTQASCNVSGSFCLAHHKQCSSSIPAHSLVHFHEFLACLFINLWLLGLLKYHIIIVVKKSNKLYSNCQSSSWSGATPSFAFLSLHWGSLTAHSSSVARPSRVWKWFDSLVNFIGSKPPLAGLIIFRDLKARGIHGSAKPSPAGNRNGGDGSPVVQISRENGGGGESWSDPCSLEKENSGGLRELIKRLQSALLG